MSSFNKHRPFISLSRRQRRKKVIELKTRIYRERHRCGGVFHDDCDIQHFEDNPDHIWAWSDIYFVGCDPADLWNAEITKVHLAQRNDYKEEPLVKFREGDFDDWQC